MSARILTCGKPATRRHFLRRFFRRETGSATIEFAIFVPVVMMILFAGIEAGIITARQAMLERGMESTMRALRLGRIQPVTLDSLRENVCNNSVMLTNCRENLLIELRRLDPNNVALPAGNAPCVNRSEETVPAVSLTPGVEHDLMLVRLCLIVDPLFPTSGHGLGLPLDESGGFRMTAASVYVNEPR
ncbi:MAG: pilus assembly protein [Pararhodobacter sp.]|nr:pilus assembly protein [Pararhodobacter sp.]